MELTSEGLNAVAFSQMHTIQHKTGDVFLDIIPVFTSYGIAIGMHTALCAKLKNVLIPRFEAEKLAKLITELVPSVEMFRMLGSGTEAAMCAARVARLKTKNKNILKMGGAYHGWSDQLAYGIRIPGTKGLQSRGIPGYVFGHTDEFFPGDLDDLEKKLKRHKIDGGTAAVYLEPVGPESGTWPISKEFVRGVEELAHEYGALLIFDEVVTGFRIGTGGAQEYFGIDPDLTIFGKVIAGGYPGAGGIGGHMDCMQHLGAGLDSSGKKIKKALCGGTMAATPISCCARCTWCGQ